MSAVIYKYPLKIDGNFITIANKVIKFLKIDIQRGIPILWALVDPEDFYQKPICITSIGTGWPLKDLDNWIYIDSVQDDLGYVWHYFAENYGKEKRLKIKDLLKIEGYIYTIPQMIQLVKTTSILDQDGFGELFDITTGEYQKISTVEDIDFLMEMEKKNKYLIIWYNK